jgi:hypothetical protein
MRIAITLAVSIVALCAIPCAAQSHTVVISNVTAPNRNQFPPDALNGSYVVSDRGGGKSNLASALRKSPTFTYIGYHHAMAFLAIEDPDPKSDEGSAVVIVTMTIGSGATGHDGKIIYRKTVSKPVNLGGLTLPFVGAPGIGSNVGYAGSQARVQ